MYTLAELILLRCEQQSEDLACRHIADDGSITECTYGQLGAMSRKIGAELQARSEIGDRAILLYPSGLEFIVAFCGCLLAGVVAVPTYPTPGSARLAGIAHDASPKLVLTTEAMRQGREAFVRSALKLDQVEWLATDKLDVEGPSAWKAPALTPETLALLQYTSGSTTRPKGVKVTHANLLNNERAIEEAFGNDSATHMVSWLPVYHDMGLIGSLLQPIYLGGSCTLMGPLTFLQRPIRWLEAISRFRGTVSGAPNFAYELCARKVRPEELAGLDLSSWVVAFNGAEPVRPATLDRFRARFEPHGFKPEALYPTYGLAEATLLVTGIEPHARPAYKYIAAEPMAENRVVESHGAGTGMRRIVSCGRPLTGHRVAIVDPETRLPCPPQTIGEIWISGPSVASGYWKRPAESSETFEALMAGGDGTRFLRSGDLGFVNDGELFVTGRLKDMIILRGRNLYPQDLELTAEAAHPAIRPGCCAAFSLDVDGDEQVAIVAEALQGDRDHTNKSIVDSIRSRVAEEHNVRVSTVTLIAPRTIPKTSSGKIQRHACRERLLDGTLATVAASELGAEPFQRDAALDPAADSVQEATRRTAIERDVRRVAGELLKVELATVELTVAPAAIGLDSLMAVELQAQLEAALGLVLPSGLLWQHSTLSSFVNGVLAIWADAGEAVQDTEQPGLPGGDGTELRASSGQERLWFLDRLSPGSPAYNVHLGLRIQGSLDTGALQASLDRLLARHAVLRTALRERDGILRQIVQPAGKVPLERIDLSCSSGTRVADELRAVANALATRAFDLEHGPLLRFHLVTVGADEHVLLIAQHHAVTDGWSASLLVIELIQLYDASVRGLPLPEPPRHTFAHFCRWERSTAVLDERDRGYWANQLWDVPTLSLPAARQSAGPRSHRGGRIPFTLQRAQVEELLEIGREEGCTQFVTLLTAYAALLSRLTGQEDFAVGTVVANRDRMEFREIVGFLANTVAVRFDLTGRPTIRELLRRARATMSAALRHSALPFAEVVALGGSERVAGEHPLFDVSFVFERDAHSFSVAGTTWETVSWAPDGSVEGTAKFGLSLAVQEHADHFTCALEYDADRLDARTAQALVERFVAFLTTLAGVGTGPVTTLPVLVGTDRRRLLHDWNTTASEVPNDIPFVQLFEQQVVRSPEAVAIVDDQAKLSYSALDLRMRRLARRLHDEGVGPETLVALLMPRGIDLLTSMLAVFKVGAAYVPLDPSHPVRRQMQVIERSGATCLIVASELADQLRSAAVELGSSLPEIVGTQEIECSEQLLGDPELELPSRVSAYVMFTSGSTGEPKGVIVEQRGMVNHLFAKIHDLDLTADDTVAQTASQCFDISVWQFLSPLLVGGQVRVLADDDAHDSLRLLRRAAAERVSILELVPSALRPALDAVDDQVESLGSLRRLVLTGEALPLDLARRWFERYPEIPIVNAYGPTECSDDVTHELIRDVAAPTGPNAAIGRPVLNTRIYALDHCLEPVVPSVPGELYVGGAGVGRGYLDDPRLTAESFLPDPFSGVPGARMYRTGDLGRWLEDGRIEFLGRVDQQVKVRGFRVELSEVEAVLTGLGGVSQAVVAVRDDEVGGPRLVAYVVGGEGFSPGVLRDELRARLPDYMVPSRMMMLDELPLTANGKVDRRALPDLECGRPEGMDEFVTPEGRVEQLVAAVWEEMLGIQGVGAEDDFFSLGGHSLLATQVVARLRRVFGFEVPLRQLFEAPTVAGLARFVTSEEEVLGQASGAIAPAGHSLAT